MIRKQTKLNIDSKAVFSGFREHIAQYYSFKPETWDLLEPVLEIKIVPKNAYSLGEGQICRFIDFLYKGSFRMMHNRDGKEVTTGLYTPAVCITNMKSLSASIPSELYLQALEDSIVVRLYKEQLISLYIKSTDLQSMGRAILESMVIAENNWKEMYTLYEPEERYLFLMRKAPAILQQIPLQYVASFLGIRRETLSRIRARLVKA